MPESIALFLAFLLAALAWWLLEQAQGAYRKAKEANDRSIENLAEAIRLYKDTPCPDCGFFLDHQLECPRRVNLKEAP